MRVCRSLEIWKLGTVNYLEALKLQEKLVSKRKDHKISDILSLQHPPTYILGKRRTDHNLLIPESELKEIGAALHYTQRGFDITFHGPRQAILYPIVCLCDIGFGARSYVEKLEQTMIEFASLYGFRARSGEKGEAGVWVGERNIGAIGVQISSGITSHGLASNIDPDLSYFKHIVPCGIADKEVTSLKMETDTAITPSGHVHSSFHRSNFSASFMFGTASSAYQFEGAANEGGRGPSIWDTYIHKYPGKIKDHSNANVAVDSYHRYKEDVDILKDMGWDAYSFSISWSRVLPYGKLSKGVNKEGIKYYNNLIDELVSKGLQPFVTLYHWDLPQALEDEYGGFLNDKIVGDFQDYAELCYKEFGDRVKYWITLNEPLTYSIQGYISGQFPPLRCSDWQHMNCTGGDSSTEPYIVSHNQLLSHAAAVKIYKEKYQILQKGKIGISLNINWMVPNSSLKHAQNAAIRALDFMFGWFMDPLTSGRYPHVMRSLVRERLPKFTKAQAKMVKGSFDFLGLNYYTASYVSYCPYNNRETPSYLFDAKACLKTEKNGIPIGPKTGSSWLYVYPRGIQDLLQYTKEKYYNPIIYITENGVSDINNGSLPLKEALVDTLRVEYHRDHLIYIQRAIKEGVDVRGYFAWSLSDSFEWGYGYSARFGINYVDYTDGLKKYPKHSALWFKKFLKK